MDIPNHLSHKPVIKLENYSDIDGKYAGNTDVHGLSVGFSQWGNEDLSLKVWRHSGKRWSRMSEELPLHRVLDSACLICSALSLLESDVLLDDGNFNVSTTNDQEMLSNFKELITSDKENIRKSFKRLSKMVKMLEKVGY